MHEFSLMTSIMDIAQQELERHGATRITLLRIRYGALDEILPTAMRTAFDALIAGSPHEGARIELEEERLELRCSLCGHTFHPDDRTSLYAPCPLCGKQAPFSVVRGEGVFLDHLEAE